MSICRVCVCTCINFQNCCSLKFSFMEANVSLSHHLGHNYMCWGPSGFSAGRESSFLLSISCALCSALQGIDPQWPISTYISHEGTGEGESIQLRNSQCANLGYHPTAQTAYSIRYLFRDTFPNLHRHKLHRQVLVAVSAPNLFRPYNHRAQTWDSVWETEEKSGLPQRISAFL